MKLNFLATFLFFFVVCINITFAQEASSVIQNSSSSPIKEHIQKDLNSLEDQSDQLSTRDYLWELFRLDLEDISKILLFEEISAEDEGPVQYDAPISQYVPSEVQDTLGDKEALLLEALLDTLDNSESFIDPTTLQFDSESLSILVEDWKLYIDYLYEAFPEELKSFPNRASIDSFMFESLDADKKKDLTSSNISTLEKLMSSYSEIDQHFLLSCLDDMTQHLEEKIFSNISEEELLNGYMAILDQFLAENEEPLPEISKSEDQTTNIAVQNFESSKNFNIDQLEDALQNSNTKQPNLRKPQSEIKNFEKSKDPYNLYQRVLTCSDLNNMADACESVEQCMYIPAKENNKEAGQCKVDPSYMEYLVNSGCKKESRLDLLTLARDLQSEGIFDQPTVDNLFSTQDVSEICKTLTFSFFGNFLSAFDIPQISEFEATEWNSLTPQQKLDMILMATHEI